MLENSNVCVTICIVTYNTKELIRACLSSIYSKIKDIDFEVVVVDNNSTDGSIEMIKSEFSMVNLIQNKENVGFAKANNQAIYRSSGKYFLLLNSDTVILQESIERMVEFMDSSPQAGAVGCIQIHPDGTIQPTINISLNMWSNLWLIFIRLLNLKRLVNSRYRVFIARHFRKLVGQTVNAYLSYYSLPSGPVEWLSPLEVDWVSGVCLLARRETINQAGLLDENFFMYIEDVDWCLRMKQKDWKVYLLPDVKVIHYVGQSAKQLFDEIYPCRYECESIFYFFKKYYGKRGVVLLKLLITLSMLIRGSAFLVSYLLTDKKEEMKRRLKTNLELMKFGFIL